jgi:NAD(P)-dependent dehydrogenase (short-subunit alcohol dehydrogenase family)
VLVQGDISNANRAEEIVHEAAHKLGGCDIFVQSVIPRLEDIYEYALATEVPLAKWQLAFDTQVCAFFVGARAAAKYMTQ